MRARRAACRAAHRTGPVLAAVGLAAFAWACGPEPPSDAPAPPPSVRVLLVGDSITAGRVSRPRGPSYAERLAHALGPDFEVVNLGCGGTSTWDWTRSRGAVLCGQEYALPNLYESRVRPELPADLVTVLLGTNDSTGLGEDHWLPPEDYEAALREIVTNLRADGARRVMLLGPPLVIHRANALLRLVKYGDALQRLCEEMSDDGVLCGPDVRYLLDADDFASGNVHPNASGHRKIADALVDAVRALYPEEAGARESSDAAASSSSPG